MICNSGDIVTIPFPFIDNANTNSRPALVVSSKIFNEKHDHTVMTMITTGASIKWDTDVEIIDITLAGLPIKSFVRFKFFTLDNRLIKKSIGRLDDKSFDKVKDYLTKYLFI